MTTKGQHMSTTLQVIQPLPIEILGEMTNDPIDAMRIAADFYAMSAYYAERALAIPPPRARRQPPKPISKVLRTFQSSLKTKLTAIASLFDRREIERLKRILPPLAHQLDQHDPRVVEDVFGVVCMTPAEAASWVREHLDELEARFAS